MWGLLPIALQITLEQMDAFTITWYRFMAATFLLGSYLAVRRNLPRLRGQGMGVPILLVLVTLGLGGNYILYLLGLSYTSAGAAQVLIQLAPVIAMLGSLVFFQERFSKVQWLGLLVLSSGMGFFFHNKLEEVFLQLGEYSVGVVLILFAALAWAVYAIAQKQLLNDMSSAAVLMVVYLGSALLLLPTASPRTILDLSPLHFGLLVFCALNTLIAYGAFSEALAHWEASRVNAVLALTPVATLLMILLGSSAWPEVVASEELTGLSWLGAVLVVLGSMTVAVGKSSEPVQSPARKSI
jgi:drug/metabolite transporter (DMT)-like permease